MVKRGEGTYVADQPSQPKKAEKNEALRDGATRYASTAIAVGADLDDAVDELHSAFERVVRDHRRRA
jgi:DNA-binding transcriptional regulator YhcF (GntR family)